MAKNVTLTQLLASCRNQADMENSTFISDANLTVLINNSADALWDLILNQNPDFSVSSKTFTLTGSSDSQTLETDFYRLRGIDDLSNSDHPCSVRPFNWAERNDYSYNRILTQPQYFSPVFYILSGNTIKFTPPNMAQRDYKAWYNPARADLAAGGDTFDSVNGWDEFVIYDVAIKMLSKEESSTTGLERLKADTLKRILTGIPNRDMSQPKKIVRIRSRRVDKMTVPSY